MVILRVWILGGVQVRRKTAHLRLSHSLVKGAAHREDTAPIASPTLRKGQEQRGLEAGSMAAWTEKCPVCKEAALQQVDKKILGVIPNRSVACPYCGALFVKRGKQYRLSKVADASYGVWQEYGKQPLCPREWRNIALGGMSDAKQKEADRVTLLEILQGPEPLKMVFPDVPIMLQRGEEAWIAFPSINLMEMRVASRGAHSSVSLRIAKGVTVRTGQFAKDPREILTIIDTGTFVVTNKRLVFVGASRTVNTTLSKIITVTPFADGIALSRTGKQKIEYFAGFDRLTMTFDIDGRMYEETLTGELPTLLIQNLVRLAR